MSENLEAQLPVVGVKADARNRALRSFLQGLAFDVAAVVVLILYTTFANAESWGTIEWTVLAFTLAKTASVAGLSYMMRTVFKDKIPPATVVDDHV